MWTKNVQRISFISLNINGVSEPTWMKQVNPVWFKNRRLVSEIVFSTWQVDVFNAAYRFMFHVYDRYSASYHDYIVFVKSGILLFFLPHSSTSYLRIQSKAAAGTVALWLAGLTVSRSWVQIHWFPGIFLYEYSGLLPKMHLELIFNLI